MACAETSDEKATLVLMTTAPEDRPLAGTFASCFEACQAALPSLVPAFRKSDWMANFSFFFYFEMIRGLTELATCQDGFVCATTVNTRARGSY